MHEKYQPSLKNHPISTPFEIPSSLKIKILAAPPPLLLILKKLLAPLLASGREECRNYGRYLNES